jgi:hypothetical protein
MKLSTVIHFISFWTSTVSASFLGEWQLANLFESRQLACHQDDCLRAINGTRRGPDHPATGTMNCMNFMTTTYYIDPMYVFERP